MVQCFASVPTAFASASASSVNMPARSSSCQSAMRRSNGRWELSPEISPVCATVNAGPVLGYDLAHCDSDAFRQPAHAGVSKFCWQIQPLTNLHQAGLDITSSWLLHLLATSCLACL